MVSRTEIVRSDFITHIRASLFLESRDIPSANDKIAYIHFLITRINFSRMADEIPCEPRIYVKNGWGDQRVPVTTVLVLYQADAGPSRGPTTYGGRQHETRVSGRATGRTGRR